MVFCVCICCLGIFLPKSRHENKRRRIDRSHAEKNPSGSQQSDPNIFLSQMNANKNNSEFSDKKINENDQSTKDELPYPLSPYSQSQLPTAPPESPILDVPTIPPPAYPGPTSSSYLPYSNSCSSYQTPYTAPPYPQ